MSTNWEPGNWKWPVKILTGIATVWPPIYIGLFLVTIFSFVMIVPFTDSRSSRDAQDINVIQLDRKIRNGEIKELYVTRHEITATDKGGAQYRVMPIDESARQEILKEAKQKDESGQPLVAKIDENTSVAEAPPGLPFAFAGLVGAHLLTIVLMLALMPFYIILAVKNERVDQTTRIIWIVLMCTMTMLAAPVYWYLYIWRKPPTNPPAIPPTAMPLPV